MASAQELIAQAYSYWVGEIPALAKLALVIRLELRGKGDVQVFRVETPGPKVSKAVPDDARVEVSLARSHFNELATDGSLEQWREAYEHGDVKVGGDPNVVKLLGNVVVKHQARARLKRVR
jgi:hypothetical protein